ncbi:MAG: 3-hydroxybutyryl-CoA dehydrogenase [Chitinophagaceae bacterium]|nr:3-hydroxybutyryl-CoA dehydrogenase [Rubrivivax sp.]
MADIRAVGVVGGGQMGRGIAQVFAASGFQVVLADVNTDALTNAVKMIERDMQRRVDRGTLTVEDREHARANLTTTTDYAAFAESDLVIEAVTENEALKNTIFRNLVGHIKPSTILASNTSSISVTRLAAATDRPERFIGIHFMNPAPVMKLVEVTRGLPTDEPTFQAVAALAERIGKRLVASADTPAFIVNRILIPMINEAVYALYEGVGDILAIDSAMKLGANHPMGPFELADYIGLDTCLAVMRVLHEELGDSKYRPCPLLAKYVDANWLGKKSGRGFYDYAVTPARPTR